MEDLIPLAGIVMVFGIPLAAILTHHQRKMTELIHSKHQAPVQSMETMHEIASLRQQMAVLQDQVNHLTIAVDRSSEMALQERTGTLPNQS